MCADNKNSTSARNVCDYTVARDLCIGCGVCAGICPPQVLAMRENAFGEYIAVEERRGCLERCDLCIRCCPFADGPVNESGLATTQFADQDNISYSTETGYYLKVWAGHVLDPNHRNAASSGGLTTWFLMEAMKRGTIDRIVCVIPTDKDRANLFNYAVLDSLESVISSAKSCYYPVQLSDAIRHILDFPGNYAVVGLPCFIKSIRLAMRSNRRLRNRVAVCIGLVCGQSKSKFFAEYICALGGGHPKYLERVSFRTKDPQRPAKNYGARFKCSEGTTLEGEVLWKSGMGNAWKRGYFKPNACNFCDDIFAETADIAFMDAWLERYSSDSRGTNLVLARKGWIVDLFVEGSLRHEIQLQEGSLSDLTTSQRGVIDTKRGALAKRLNVALSQLPYPPPVKRVQPQPTSIIESIRICLEQSVNHASKRSFRLQRRYKGLVLFNICMTIPTLGLRLVTLLQRIAARTQVIAARAKSSPRLN